LYQIIIKRFVVFSSLAVLSVLLYVLSAMTLEFLVDYNKAKEKYLKKTLFSYMVQERDKVKDKAKIVTLSYFVPSFQSAVDHVSHNKKISPKALGQYINYYQKADELLPHLREIPGLLGCFYYWQGDHASSIRHLKTAEQRIPQFFWNHYNLGVISFSKGDFSSAKEYFNRALKSDPEITLQLINASTIYRQIWKDVLGAEELVLKNYKQAYEHSTIMLQLMERYKGQMTKVEAGEALKEFKIDVRLF